MQGSRWGLVTGALAGLCLALSGAVGARMPSFASDVVARVSGVPIRRADVDTALVRLDRAAASDPALRAATRERLIDEALLVERAREMGLLESDVSVRKAVIRGVIDALAAEAAESPPDEAALRAFHAEHAARFTAPRLVRVRTIRFSEAGGPADARERAARAAAAMAGGVSFDEAARRFGDAGTPPLAGALVPETVLRRELGPSLARAVRRLAPGEISAPVETQGAVFLAELAEETPGRVSSFEAVRDAVQAELTRQRGDDALRALRERLRKQARVVVAADPPPP